MGQSQVSSEIVWQRIQSLCMSRGMNLSQLAKQAEISRATLHNLSTGTTATPRIETLQRISEVLQVDLDELCSFRSLIDSHGSGSNADNEARRSFDKQSKSRIKAVFRDFPELFAGWEVRDWDELYSTFGVGGELSEAGVAEAARQINRKREAIRKLQVILETHLGNHAEEMIDSLYRMVSVTSDNLETDAQFQRLIDNPVNTGSPSG